MVDLDTHEKHKTVSRYKTEKLSEEIEEKNVQLDEVQQELNIAAKKKTKLTEIDNVATGKTVFGGKVTVSKEDGGKHIRSRQKASDFSEVD